MTVELMRHFNKNKCVILNTYQNYLKVNLFLTKQRNQFLLINIQIK
jgi:hypothetical protein